MITLNDPTLTSLNAVILQTGANLSFSTDPTVVQTVEPWIANGPDETATAVPAVMAGLYNQFIAQASYSYRI